MWVRCLQHGVLARMGPCVRLDHHRWSLRAWRQSWTTGEIGHNERGITHAPINASTPRQATGWQPVPRDGITVNVTL